MDQAARPSPLPWAELHLPTMRNPEGDTSCGIEPGDGSTSASTRGSCAASAGSVPMMRRTLALLAAFAFTGCASVASTSSATTHATATTSSTTPAPTTTLMHGERLVQLIKSESMAGDPMMAPLYDAQWQGGYLVLSYQLDDKSIAASLCSFVSNQAPAGWTLEQFSKVQVVGPSGTLAMTNLTGPGCHEGTF